jgi:hypothetical protein
MFHAATQSTANGSSPTYTQQELPSWVDAISEIFLRTFSEDSAIKIARLRLRVLKMIAPLLPEPELLAQTIDKADPGNQEAFSELKQDALTAIERQWRLHLRSNQECFLRLCSSNNLQDSKLDLLIIKQYKKPQAIPTSNLEEKRLNSLVITTLLPLRDQIKGQKLGSVSKAGLKKIAWFVRPGAGCRQEIIANSAALLERVRSARRFAPPDVVAKAIFLAIDFSHAKFTFDSDPASAVATVLLGDISERFSIEAIERRISQDKPTKWLRVSVPKCQTHRESDIAGSDLTDLSYKDRGVTCISAERRSSDIIRLELIPQMVASKTELCEAYWLIHSTRFGSAAQAAQNFGTRSFQLSSFSVKAREDRIYSSHVGHRRTFEIQGGDSFCHTPFIFLPDLEDLFFSKLNKIVETGCVSREKALDYLCCARAVLTVLHLPFDGSGRTNEDFLTYLGALIGVPLTLSNSGYRHLYSPLVRDFDDCSNRFKYQFDCYILQGLGIPRWTFKEDSWLYDLYALLKRFSRDAVGGFEADKTLLLKRFISAMSSDSKVESLYTDFPALKDSRKILERATRETYLVAPDSVSAKLDALVADSQLIPPFKFRTALVREYKALLNSFPLGRIVMQHHLKEYGKFMSDLEQMNFGCINL